MFVAFVVNKPYNQNRLLFVCLLEGYGPIITEHLRYHCFGSQSRIGIVPSSAQIGRRTGVNALNRARTSSHY
jgi:hypothetical protein